MNKFLFWISDSFSSDIAFHHQSVNLYLSTAITGARSLTTVSSISSISVSFHPFYPALSFLLWLLYYRCTCIYHCQCHFSPSSSISLHLFSISLNLLPLFIVLMVASVWYVFSWGAFSFLQCSSLFEFDELSPQWSFSWYTTWYSFFNSRMYLTWTNFFVSGSLLRLRVSSVPFK